ncbi:Putative 1,3-beta-glucanosyltransferase [Komagataella phaffii CBS 7435]|uniref:1,3-beta-glucanosyltransferase n=2 Tax=Komagataella phaffii TaxID=460519 RepID=C4R9F4_KOMPG|nr:GQ67_01382T0 [Komagataella phaffii]AOA66784.1 GQ68_01398T0 [Komagataella phaffii GS115]CAH2447441.1 Putative 1,3-beta-glucanosyltransferase [Komagataella phaffii CBS 7435]CAY67049.1 Glycolipid-anchored surface protein [Komagataella pastoris]CCA37670.1 Putative 1,3-beta-glucanosyltransferase [Komagataella phaffii CBS 7435]
MKLLLPLLTLVAVAKALIPLQIKGHRFIKPAEDAREEGEVFFIKGIDYQPGGASEYTVENHVDVLSDPEACYRDAYVLQQLGINTIRVYTVDPAKDHDECMTIFNNAGIYVFLDVNSPLGNESINREDPASSYNAGYLYRIFSVVEAFKEFPNVAGFFSGNEVINDAHSAEVSPKYIRAVQRDLHKYIEAHSDRAIPVGYSAADDIELRAATWDYLQCNIDGEDDDLSKSDFFGLNSYEWCSGISNWQSSGYAKTRDTFKNTSIPIFFSEYGCNTRRPRTFDEISDGLFDGLSDVFSGGLVYEYSEEANNYGVVEISSSGEIEYLDDFSNLQDQYQNAPIPDISEADAEEPELTTCDADGIKSLYSEFDPDFDLPEFPEDAEDLLENGIEDANVGKLIDNLEARASNYTIKNADGDEIEDAVVSFADANLINSQTGLTSSTTGSTSASSTRSATATSSSSSSTSEDGANQYQASLAGLSAAIFLMVNMLI